MTISERAAGHWPRIISALVGEKFTNTRKHLPCPRGEGVDRFRFSNRDGRGNYFCMCSDGRQDGFALIQCVKGCKFAQAAALVESVIGVAPDRNQTVRSEVERMETTTISQSNYLDSRGLEMAPGLRWARAVDYFEDGKLTGTYRAMVGEIRRGDEAQLLGHHVTYLQNGAKAPVSNPRKILKGGVSGGSVRLYPAAATMGVAEGVESAIAAKMLHRMPVWAALTASMLTNWTPPEIARHVVIFGDNDSNFAGQASAFALAKRLKGMGLCVDVVLPPEFDLDWNDVLLASLCTNV